MPATADLDAIVVGAGLSGLVCAHRLAAAGAGLLVLEARVAPGGRLRSIRLDDGGTYDLGGQWLSDGQPRLAALATSLGIATVPQYRDGVAVLALAAAPPRRLLSRALAALTRRRQLAVLSRLLRQAGRAPDPAWDTDSLGAWLERTIADPAVREQVTLHAELTFAADPHDLSLLGYLTDLAAQDGADPFTASNRSTDGGHERRFVGGARRLPDALAASLGEQVCLATPVRAITAASDHVVVTTDRGELRARRAVVAIPPARAAAITFTPALPARAAQLLASSRPGAVIKLVATYPHAFWRADGLSGEAYQTAGLVRATVDGSAPDGGPALIAFVVAAAAARWDAAPEPARRAQITDELATLFGPAAAAPTALAVMDWVRDPWTGGCAATLPPGAARAAPAWRGPFGRIHVAGTESAASWPGFMEGAIEAGERAAREVLAAAVP